MAEVANWDSAGLSCVIVQHDRLGHLCGYVGLPDGHPWHGTDYDYVEPYPEVHGGLTYAADHAPMREPDGRWWLGFDCAHLGDLVPGIGRSMAAEDVYRDEAFVKAECEKLVAQAIEAGGEA